MVSAVLLIASLFTVGLSKPISRGMQLHEKRDNVPSGFSLSGAASPDTMLNLRIALVQSDPAGLEHALYDVSDPASPNYGQHLSKEEAAAYVAPTSASLAAVTSWLQANDISATALTPAADWMGFSVPVSKANELFDADFSVFTHESTGKQAVRTLSYSIPNELSGHLDFVYPTTTFPIYQNKPVMYSKNRVPSKRVHPSEEKRVDASCSSTITPSCLQQIYGIPSAPATQSSNQLLVTGFIGQYANQADLKQFLTSYRPDISSSTTFTVQTLDGGENDQNQADAGDEADLDTQYTTGVATGVPITFLSVGEDNSDDVDGFLDVVNYLLGESSPPQAMSTSYEFNESDLTYSIANNLCNAYAQLGARGVSIMFSSGDGGVSGTQSSSCTDFVPTFPSSCPYVTAVGATQGYSPEVAASFSTGGFSNFFGVPSYQSSQVSSYLSSIGSTNSGLYNASGRGIPDVSAQGVDFVIVVDGTAEGVDGTSCSSPTFTSVISLLNDQLIAAGKSPLGFLNPFLYSTGTSALNDITSGDNPGCNTNGFSAAAGWDPVTGLGTPNFAALQTAVGL